MMRYLPHTTQDRREMMAAIGISSIDELFTDVPAEVQGAVIELPGHQGEMAVEAHLKALAGRNLSAADAPCFLGGGAYRHYVPAAVDHLIQRSEFLTAYTPYQPEISQGTLQALFEFQTQVALLTGMEVANASMYDGASACAEAVLMAFRINRKRGRALLSGNLHPHYRRSTETLLQHMDYILESGAPATAGGTGIDAAIDEDTACVVVQNPDVFGQLHDLRPLADAAHEKGALLIVVVTEVVSLGLVESPGAMGADIVVGEGQSLGNGLNFGGPYVGLFAARQKFVRQMPGRLCGETVDEDGKRGFVLTLSTREQHIRREKATSNICTNSGLCSLAFAIHCSLLGEAGLNRLDTLNHAKAVELAERLEALDGVEVLPRAFFNEFAVSLSRPAAAVVATLADEGILAGIPARRLFAGDNSLDNILIVAATETNSDDDVARLIDGLGRILT
jgi:glycine dehydrogenase subunit 1